MKIAGFVAVMFVVGRRVFPGCFGKSPAPVRASFLLFAWWRPQVSLAYGAAELFGVSFALGAFFAGMVIRESEFSHRAAEESLPLRDAFAVLFFVSVGMLFDPSIIVEHPWRVLSVLLIIIVGKSLAAAVLVAAFRYPWKYRSYGFG